MAGSIAKRVWNKHDLYINILNHKLKRRNKITVAGTRNKNTLT